MAKTKRIRRTVSDLDAMSIESFLNGDGSSYNSYDDYSSEAYIDPVLGQEVRDILSDPDTDHGTAMMRTMECMNEMNLIAQSIENYINTRQLKIKMCNAFAKAAQRKGYGLEAIDFWRSMESDDPDDDKEKSKDDDKWYKNFWEAVKAFFKKLILMVINFIKTIGNFIKGAICKAQDLFYKKHAKDIVKHAKDTKSGYFKKDADNKTKNDDLKYKMKAVSDSELWKVKPWELLKTTSGHLVTTFSSVHKEMMDATTGNVGADSSKLVEDIRKAIHVTSGVAAKKVSEQAGKWFPSAAKIVNEAIYGKETPSKHELTMEKIFVDHAAHEILSPAALTAMTYAFKTAQQANKSLNTCLKVVEKMTRQNKGFEGDEKKKNGRSSAEKVNKAKRASQFITTYLIQLYGTCLSARMAVFGAAKKLYKKGEYESEK